MRVLQGQLTVCIDPAEAAALYNQGWRVICLSETNEFKDIMPEAMTGSVFLPPYECMDMLLDGNMDEFSATYSNYLLSSNEVEMMVSIILAAMYQGINIVFMISQSEYELGFYQIFSVCFGCMTGITIGFSMYMPSAYNPNFNDSNMVRLYMDGFIGYPDLLVYADNPILDPYVCIRICGDIGFITTDEKDAVSYISSYFNNIKGNNNKFLEKGLIKV